ncbi:hypothetical protein [Ramlibacter sp.]|nr:hypothetical protein [Ramlibacter sp.]MDB5956417.1 hypothetical protein [Ramlibacter sp.]
MAAADEAAMAQGPPVCQDQFAQVMESSGIDGLVRSLEAHAGSQAPTP